MSEQDRDRANNENTDQLNDLFVGGFDQEFGDEIFIDDSYLAEGLFVKGGHLDQTLLSGAGRDQDPTRDFDELNNGGVVPPTPRQHGKLTSRFTGIESDEYLLEDLEEILIDDDEEIVIEDDEETLVVDGIILDPIVEELELPRTYNRTDKSASNPQRPPRRRQATTTSNTDKGLVAFSSTSGPTGPRRRLLILAWMTLLLFPLVASSATYSKISARPDVWQARAEVQYRGSAWTETQDIAVQSRSLLAPVAEQFDIPIAEFESNVDAGLLTGTQVVRIEYRSIDKQQAQEIVTSLAASYITRTSELTPDGVFETLETQRSEVEVSLNEAKTRQQEIPPGISSERVAERAAVAAEIDALEQRLTVVESKILEVSLENFDLNANRLPVLLTEPFLFSEPVAPKPTLWAAATMLVAVLLSGTLAVIILSHTTKRKLTWLGAKK